MPISKQITGALAGLALAAAAAPALAEGFPDGPIEVINNSKPGGGSDIFLRFATERAGEILGGDFLHLSKTGGVATNTLKYAAGKPADGQTLFIADTNNHRIVTVDLASRQARELKITGLEPPPKLTRVP